MMHHRDTVQSFVLQASVWQEVTLKPGMRHEPVEAVSLGHWLVWQFKVTSNDVEFHVLEGQKVVFKKSKYAPENGVIEGSHASSSQPKHERSPSDQGRNPDMFSATMEKLAAQGADSNNGQHDRCRTNSGELVGVKGGEYVGLQRNLELQKKREAGEITEEQYEKLVLADHMAFLHENEAGADISYLSPNRKLQLSRKLQNKEITMDEYQVRGCILRRLECLTTRSVQ
jgi:hypothetical protein